MRAAEFTREERAEIRLNRYRKRAAVQRAAANRLAPNSIRPERPRVLRTSGLTDKKWQKRKRARKVALASRRRNRR